MPSNPFIAAGASIPRFFVGRIAQVCEIVSFVEATSAKEYINSGYILNLNGSPGYGKSALIRKLREHLSASDTATFCQTTFDLDHISSSISGPEALWLVRNSLHKARIRTPLFDCYYILFFKYILSPGQSITLEGLFSEIAGQSKSLGEKLSDGPEAGWLSKLFDPEMSETIVDIAGGIGEQLKGVETLAKLNELVRDKSRRKKLKSEGFTLDTSDSYAFQGQAPLVLALDIADALGSDTSKPLALVLDGFDKIQESVGFSPSPAEAAIERLAAALLYETSSNSVNKLRIGIVSRNQISWRRKFDEPDATDTWDQYISEITLPALTPDDANDFLSKLSASADSSGRTELGQWIRSNRNDLLSLVSEGANGAVVPIHLELLAACLWNGDNSSLPASISIPTNQMEERYLRSIAKDVRSLLEVISVFGTIERDSFKALVQDSTIVGFTSTDYEALGNIYFLDEGEFEGSYRVQGHIAGYLLRSLLRTPVDRNRGISIAEHSFDALISLLPNDRFPATITNASGSKAVAIRMLRLCERLVKHNLFDTKHLTYWQNFEFAFASDTHVASAERRQMCILLVDWFESKEQTLLQQISTGNGNDDMKDAILQTFTILHKYAIVQAMPTAAQKIMQTASRLGLVKKYSGDTLISAEDINLSGIDISLDVAFAERASKGVENAIGSIAVLRNLTLQMTESKERTALLATAARYLGDCYREIGDWKAALYWQEEGLAQALKINDQRSPEIAKFRGAVALALLENGRIGKAERYLKDSLEVLHIHYHRTHVHIMNAEFLLADVDFRKGNMQKALVKMDSCIEELGRSPDAQAVALANLLKTHVSRLKALTNIALGGPRFPR